MKDFTQFIFVFILLFSVLCGRTQSIRQNTGDDLIDSLIHIHFPNDRTAEHEIEARPVFSDEFYIPEDFLNNGVWFRRAYEYSANDLKELLISLSEFQSMKHNKSCFICDEFDNKSDANECGPIDVPISTFLAERNYFNIQGGYLGEDFDVFVTDSKQGIFIPDRNLSSNYCSEKWKHGFSRGIAISEERGLALFWLLFW